MTLFLKLEGNCILNIITIYNTYTNIMHYHLVLNPESVWNVHVQLFSMSASKHMHVSKYLKRHSYTRTNSLFKQSFDKTNTTLHMYVRESLIDNIQYLTYSLYNFVINVFFPKGFLNRKDLIKNVQCSIRTIVYI